MLTTFLIKAPHTPAYEKHLPDITPISFYSDTTDAALHDFILNKIFKIYPNCERLIIPCHLGTGNYIQYIGLKMGLHIRLTKALGKKRKIPLIFISSNDIGTILYTQIINQQDQTARLLTATGSIWADNSVEAVKQTLDKCPVIQDLKKEVVDKITLALPPEYESNHAVTNEWGAYQLAQSAGHTKLFKQDERMAKIRKNLYFKYLLAQIDLSNEALTVPITLKQKIDCKRKKILFIDDKAYKGWTKVLTAIFTNLAFFKAIDYKVNKDQAINELKEDAKICFQNIITNQSTEEDKAFIQAILYKIKKTDWDVILLDLRLLSQDHSTDHQYSGLQILDYIKQINAGIQVIALTASDKIWNTQNLLNKGIDGYYIKESPVSVGQEGYSTANYQHFTDQINRAISRGHLKEAFTAKQEVINTINRLLSNSRNTAKNIFLQTLKNQIQQAFDILVLADEERKNFFGYAFVAYFQICELFKYYLVTEDPDRAKQWLINHNVTLQLCKEDKQNRCFVLMLRPNKGGRVHTSNVIAALIHQSTIFSNSEKLELAQQFYFCNKMRNKIVHDADQTAVRAIDCLKIIQLTKELSIKLLDKHIK